MWDLHDSFNCLLFLKKQGLKGKEKKKKKALPDQKEPRTKELRLLILEPLGCRGNKAEEFRGLSITGVTKIFLFSISYYIYFFSQIVISTDIYR